MIPRPGTADPVWYVAYGSNLCAARFHCYLAGGRPVGARRTYTGCRDQALPTESAATVLPGGLVFAGRSTVWGGGMAFYDPARGGGLAARAYLVRFGQLVDVVAQEIRHPVGSDLVPGAEVGHGWALPSETYETLFYVDELDGLPMLTLTSLRDLEPSTPSAPYLRTVLDGLGETFGWTAEQRSDYLLGARGMAPGWTAEQLRLVAETDDMAARDPSVTAISSISGVGEQNGGTAR
ncbi:histone deacetylase [Mycolicibacterium sp. Y3]